MIGRKEEKNHRSVRLVLRQTKEEAITADLFCNALGEVDYAGKTKYYMGVWAVILHRPGDDSGCEVLGKCDGGYYEMRLTEMRGENRDPYLVANLVLDVCMKIRKPPTIDLQFLIDEIEWVFTEIPYSR